MSTSVDAYHALCRIQELLEAESLPDGLVKHVELGNALELDEASFAWDPLPLEPESGRGKGKEVKDSKKDKRGEKLGTGMGTIDIPTSGSILCPPRVSKTENAFRIQEISLKIPKGQVVAIVGPVGSGKSSLLQGIIGEMNKESGSVKFCGSVSYCPQNAWVQARRFAPRSIMLHVTKRIVECHHP